MKRDNPIKRYGFGAAIDFSQMINFLGFYFLTKEGTQFRLIDLESLEKWFPGSVHLCPFGPQESDDLAGSVTTPLQL